MKLQLITGVAGNELTQTVEYTPKEPERDVATLIGEYMMDSARFAETVFPSVEERRSAFAALMHRKAAIRQLCKSN